MFLKDIHKNLKRYIRLYFTGFAMGTADLIPGVSGGTIAFLSGIYEELIFSIKTLSGEFLRLLLKRKIKEAIDIIPFRFLVPLAFGLFTAVFVLSQVLTFLLREYSQFVWAFFFGLVLASTWVVLKRVVKWDMSDKLSFLFSIIITYFIVGMIPIETPNTPAFIFLSGAIAICAMIMPGISGSFILLLLGKYQQILAAVTQRDFFTLAIFMAGAVLGLAFFARVLSWLFKNHHDISIAILAGVMLGSVRKLWPWQEVVTTRINSHGEVVPLIVKNTIPASLDTTTILTAIIAVGGAVIVMGLYRFQITKEHTEDIESTGYDKKHQKSLKNQ